MVRLLNGTLMRIFALWQTVACDPSISVLGLSRRLWGWSGPCIAGAVVHAVGHQSGMRCTACVETHRHRDSVSDFPLLNPVRWSLRGLVSRIDRYWDFARSLHALSYEFSRYISLVAGRVALR